MDLVESGAIYRMNPFVSPRALQIPRHTNEVDFKRDATRVDKFDELFSTSTRAKELLASFTKKKSSSHIQQTKKQNTQNSSIENEEDMTYSDYEYNEPRQELDDKAAPTLIDMTEFLQNRSPIALQRKPVLRRTHKEKVLTQFEELFSPLKGQESDSTLRSHISAVVDGLSDENSNITELKNSETVEMPFTMATDNNGNNVLDVENETGTTSQESFSLSLIQDDCSDENVDIETLDNRNSVQDLNSFGIDKEVNGMCGSKKVKIKHNERDEITRDGHEEKEEEKDKREGNGVLHEEQEDFGNKENLVEEQEEVDKVQNGNKKRKTRMKIGKDISDAFKSNAGDEKIAKEKTDDDEFKKSEKSQDSSVSSESQVHQDKPSHVLDDWSVKALKTKKQWGVIVEGQRGEDQPGELWHSTIIVKRVNARCLQTKSGSTYKVKGSIDSVATLAEGFSQKFVKAFANGFPSNWKKLVTEHFDAETRSNDVKNVQIPEPRKSKKDNQQLKKIKEEKPNSKKNDKGFSTPKNVKPLKELKNSRSGRLIKPPLDWWRNERVVTDFKTNIQAYEPGFVKGVFPVPSFNLDLSLSLQGTNKVANGRNCNDLTPKSSAPSKNKRLRDSSSWSKKYKTVNSSTPLANSRSEEKTKSNTSVSKSSKKNETVQSSDTDEETPQADITPRPEKREKNEKQSQRRGSRKQFSNRRGKESKEIEVKREQEDLKEKKEKYSKLSQVSSEAPEKEIKNDEGHLRRKTRSSNGTAKEASERFEDEKQLGTDSEENSRETDECENGDDKMEGTDRVLTSSFASKVQFNHFTPTTESKSYTADGKKGEIQERVQEEKNKMKTHGIRSDIRIKQKKKEDEFQEMRRGKGNDASCKSSVALNVNKEAVQHSSMTEEEEEQQRSTRSSKNLPRKKVMLRKSRKTKQDEGHLRRKTRSSNTTAKEASERSEDEKQLGTNSEESSRETDECENGDDKTEGTDRVLRSCFASKAQVNHFTPTMESKSYTADGKKGEIQERVREEKNKMKTRDIRSDIHILKKKEEDTFQEMRSGKGSDASCKPSVALYVKKEAVQHSSMTEEEEEQQRNTRSSKNLPRKKVMLRKSRKTKQDEQSSDSEACDIISIGDSTSDSGRDVKRKAVLRKTIQKAEPYRASINRASVNEEENCGQMNESKKEDKEEHITRQLRSRSSSKTQFEHYPRKTRSKFYAAKNKERELQESEQEGKSDLEKISTRSNRTNKSMKKENGTQEQVKKGGDTNVANKSSGAASKKRQAVQHSSTEEEGPRNTRSSRNPTVRQAVLRRTRKTKQDVKFTYSELCNTDRNTSGEPTSDSGCDSSNAVTEAKSVPGRSSRKSLVRKEQAHDSFYNSANKHRVIPEVYSTDGDIDTFDEDEQLAFRPRAKRTAIYEKKSSNSRMLQSKSKTDSVINVKGKTRDHVNQGRQKTEIERTGRFQQPSTDTVVTEGAAKENSRSPGTVNKMNGEDCQEQHRMPLSKKDKSGRNSLSSGVQKKTDNLKRPLTEMDISQDILQENDFVSPRKSSKARHVNNVRESSRGVGALERFHQTRTKTMTTDSSSKLAAVTLPETEEEENEVDEQVGEWHEDEIERLHEGLLKIAPCNPHFWLKIAQHVQTKSALQCQDFYRESKEPRQQIIKKQNMATKKNKQGIKKNVTAVTGGVGTIKRKREIRALLEKNDDGYEDDIFDATPFKKQKTQLKFPLAVSAASEQEEFEEVTAPSPTYKTPSGRTPGNSYRPLGPGSVSKTPDGDLISPSLLLQVNSRDVDHYIYKVQQGKRKGARIKHKAQGKTKAVNSLSSIRSTYGEMPAVSSEMFEVNAVSDPDSEEEKDYYWSDE